MIYMVRVRVSVTIHCRVVLLALCFGLLGFSCTSYLVVEGQILDHGQFSEYFSKSILLLSLILMIVVLIWL